MSVLMFRQIANTLPFFSMSSVSLPVSAMRPFFRTTIRSADFTVESLCAIMMTVLFRLSSDIALCMSCSVLVSSELVASS